MECRLCSWVLHQLQYGNLEHLWPETPEGEDEMLRDLARFDVDTANSLWRVAHEMSEEELKWLDFTYPPEGKELEPGGEQIEVTSENKHRYVRLYCTTVLCRQAYEGLRMFRKGFFEILPDGFLPSLCREVPAVNILGI